MRLQSGAFNTGIDEDGDFTISITTESDVSLDGGYTFEDVTSSYYLNVDNAKHLIDELTDYVKQK